MNNTQLINTTALNSNQNIIDTVRIEGREEDTKPGSSPVVVAPDLPTIYDTKEEAMRALQANRKTNQGNLTRERTGGPKRENCRSHVVYAWGPAIRKVGKDFVSASNEVMWVYHATKGWKLAHGAIADNPQ